MDILNRFKRLSMWNKIGVLGSAASLLGLAIAFWPEIQGQQNIEIHGNIVDSNVFQISGLSESQVRDLFSETVNENSKIDSLIKELRTNQKSLLNREIVRISKHFPSGYKKESILIAPTELSDRLKKGFAWMKKNFTKNTSGKEFKRIDSLLVEIQRDEPFFPYIWFYRGLMYSFVRSNKTYGAKFLEIAKSHFERADKLFDIFLIREPNNPYLLLYKGMNLTHLSKARESVLYLNESLRIKPDIFDRHELLGIICYWKHIDSGYAKVWKSAFDKY